MKSSRPSTLKGQANQIIKQIVKVVLPSDVVQLQPGRRKKPKKGVKKPRVGRASYAPRDKAPVDGRRPKAPEGFLSHNIRQDKPQYPSVFGDGQPRPFAQQTFQPPPSQSFYNRQKQEETDKQLARILQIIERDEKKETPGKPTPGQPSFSGLSRQATVQGQPPASQGVFLVPRTGVSIPAEATSVPLFSSKTPMASVSMPSANRPQIPATALLFRQLSSPPTPSPFYIQEQQVRGLMPLSSAPNQANQPSVDITPEGKEEEKLQPQQGAMTFIQPQTQPQPYEVASQASSSSEDVFGSQQAGASEQRRIDFSQPVNLKIFGDSDEEEEDDSIRRAELLQDAKQIKESFMMKGGTPLPGLLRKDGKLTPAGRIYFNKLEAYITDIQRPGTPLKEVPKFKE